VLYAFSMDESGTQPARADAQVFFEAFIASPIGIALENMEGRPLFANPALCAMLGFSEEEIREKHCIEFSPPEDAEKDWALFEQLRRGLRKHYSLDKRFFRRDGSLFLGRVSISLLTDRPYPLVVAMVEEIREDKTAQEEVSPTQANLHRLAGHLIQAQEEERATVARELRDGVNDRLMLVLGILDHLQYNLPESMDEVRLKIGETREQLLNISQNVHALSHNLHSWKLDYLGLAKAAASLCKELAAREQVEIDFNSRSIPQELPEEISLCLFRVLQEALRIAIENSASRKFQVSLGIQSHEIHLSVHDPTSFCSERIKTECTLSLTGMTERLMLVSGKLSVDSEPQQGTAIRAYVPLSPKMKSFGPEE